MERQQKLSSRFLYAKQPQKKKKSHHFYFDQNRNVKLCKQKSFLHTVVSLGHTSANIDLRIWWTVLP